MKMKFSKMRSESSECKWNAKDILIHLESYLEECAQEVWESNRRSLDMHTTWWHVKNSELMEMILMVFREQSEEDDQMNTVRKPVILNTRNLARMGTDLERARRILGMTTRRLFTEDTVFDREPRFVQMGTGHHEELTEEIDEAGIRKVACDCGTGGD